MSFLLKISTLLIFQCFEVFSQNFDQTETISFNVLHGASDALSLQLDFDEDAVNSVINHGCWCSKLNTGHKPPFLLGGRAVDDLDHICKLWIQDRRCCRLYGGPCYDQFESASYTIHYDLALNQVNTTSCYENGDICEVDGCLTDSYYANQVKLFLESSSGWVPEPATRGTCVMQGSGTEHHNLAGYFSYCEGEFNYDQGYPEFTIKREFLQCQCLNGTTQYEKFIFSDFFISKFTILQILFGFFVFCSKPPTIFIFCL